MGLILDALNREVRSAKAARGVTLTTLAGKMGFTASHLSQVLGGKTNLSEKLLDLFCEALEIELIDLLEPPEISYLNPEHDALHRRIQKLLESGYARSVERSMTAIEQAISQTKRKP